MEACGGFCCSVESFVCVSFLEQITQLRNQRNVSIVFYLCAYVCVVCAYEHACVCICLYSYMYVLSIYIRIYARVHSNSARDLEHHAKEHPYPFLSPSGSQASGAAGGGASFLPKAFAPPSLPVVAIDVPSRPVTVMR